MYVLPLSQQFVCTILLQLLQMSFSIRKKYSDQENQATVKRLVSEIKTLDSSIPSLQVIGKNTIMIMKYM